jgi:hypoxanthine phosphoribosyltransferase
MSFAELRRHHIEPLISREEVVRRTYEIASEIKETSNGLSVVLLGALTGAGKFTWDLSDALWSLGVYDVMVDFMAVESYGKGTHTNRQPKITKVPKMSVKDMDVRLVEDIVDSGYSLRALLDMLYSMGARSVNTTSLLWKDGAQELDVAVDQVGFHIPKEFVIGTGIDWEEYYRSYPGIGIVKFDD